MLSKVYNFAGWLRIL